MKEESLKNKKLYSAYVVCCYLLILGFVNYFFSTNFSLLEDYPNTQYKPRSAFLFGGAFLIFQIYNTSSILYQRLIDTLIVMAFILTMVYPTFCLFGFFIFSPYYLFFVMFHFLILIFMLYDKNK